MILFKKIGALQRYLDEQKAAGASIGFVPTMGALHDGHLSLIEQCRSENSITICSIFVNPKQFNDPKDFEKYPVTIDKDILMLESAGCDCLFMPSVDEIYPNADKPHYDLGFLETTLEGKFRPGHFQGVCMVVHRLLDIVMPDHLYLGQKDFQQCMVIKKLIQLIGMSEKTKVSICPTLREPDGLAMSSRNLRLDPGQRKKAPGIYKALVDIKSKMKDKSPSQLKQEACAKLEKEGFKVDYIEIADAATLQPLEAWNQNSVVLAAAFLGEIRLIDNLIIQ